MHHTHPILSGFVTNSVLPYDAELGGGLPSGEAEPSSCILDYTTCFEAKASAPQEAVEQMKEMLPKSCVNAVIHAKELMEAAE